MTNMMVMLGAMILQPMIGRLLDWSLYMHHPAAEIAAIDTLQELYTPADYQLALSIIPLGVVIAAILICFIKETHAHAKG